jgi:hypothetical protein
MKHQITLIIPVLTVSLTVIMAAAVIVSSVVTHHPTKQTKTLPCCETGVGALYGINCGPAVCGFGVITGSGK